MRTYGLIGYPLGHSFSKIFFTQKFAEEGIFDASFELFPIETINDFPGLLSSQPDLAGLAVTKPYKEAVIPFLSAVDDAVKKIGAANCIVIRNGILTGHNTDVIGFEKSLLPLLQDHHQKALVFGTGGASKGVQYVLSKMGISFLTVSREHSATKGDITYNDLDKSMMDEYPLLINTTPAGMTPDESGCPDIPYQHISARHLMYDLIYKPAETLFMKKGLERGAAVKNGHEMFLIQAEANWLYWKGVMK